MYTAFFAWMIKKKKNCLRNIRWKKQDAILKNTVWFNYVKNVKKIKWNEIRQNVNKDCQSSVLRCKEHEWQFLFFLLYSILHLAHFSSEHELLYSHTKKVFEEERLQYILYSKQGLRHWETDRAGLGSLQHLQGNKWPRASTGEMQLAFSRKLKGLLHFVDILVCLFTKEIHMAPCLLLRKQLLD